MIIDRLGKQVKKNNRIAIAQLSLNQTGYLAQGILVFATVLAVYNNSLCIKYDNGLTDPEFLGLEFIVIDDSYNVITTATLDDSIYNNLENFAYTRGFVN